MLGQRGTGGGILRVCSVIYSLHLASVGLLAATPVRSLTPPKRPVTVADMIRMTTLGDHDYSEGAPSEGRVAHFSPNGKQFVVVLRKGNIESNTNEYTLLLWQTAEVFRSSKPKKILTLSSNSNREAIADISWLDNERIAFLGERRGGVRQVYSLNTRTGRFVKVTTHKTNVLAYHFSGRTLIFTAEEPIKSIFDKKALSHGFVVSPSQSLSRLVQGVAGGWYFGVDQVFTQSVATGSRATQIPLNPSERLSAFCETPFPSPDGKNVVIATQVSSIPNQWQEYSDPGMQDLLKANLKPGMYSPLSRYLVVNVATGASRVLMNSPVGLGTCDVTWASDSKSVVLSNVYLPLGSGDDKQRTSRRSQTFFAEVNVATGEIEEISADRMKLVSWDSRSEHLVFESQRPQSDDKHSHRIHFEKRGNSWNKVSDTTQNDRPEIALEENMNNSPKIVAVDSHNGRRTMLWGFNPQFGRLALAKVEEIKWKCDDGHEVKGGLYYPAGYEPGRRYPLVIQTHGWNASRFWIDGPWTTAFAGQPLAEKGIMVLQVDESYSDINTSKEVDREVASLEGAIDYLDQGRIIDRARIGIVGFSRSCLFVKYLLTHSRYRIAAASVTDGVDGGYFQWIQEVNLATTWGPYQEGLYDDAIPFGLGLKKWMDRSPGFSLDRVETPVFITALNPSSALFQWEWFAGLTRLEKPVDLVVLEDGTHVLQKPWDRMISQQGTVDWFCFWLKDHEDSDPVKADQYRRWRKLRELQGEDRSMSPPTN